MDEISVDGFANRDEAIPVIDIEHDLSDNVGNEGHHHKRDRLRDYTSNVKGNVKKAAGKSSDSGSSIQDRLLERYALLHTSRVNNLLIPNQTPSASNSNRRPLRQ